MADSAPALIRQPSGKTGAPPLSPVRWLAPFLLVALGFRLVPILNGTLDLPRPSAARAAEPPAGDPIERPGETFPGSAWFFAEGAFARPADARGTGGTDVRGLPPEWRGNRHILAIDIGPAALPYRFAGRSPLDRVRALNCLANAVYYEAGNEPEEGQRAVAQVVLNRVRHPAWPDSVCGVVYEGTGRADLHCQFTFSCNGAMGRPIDAARWRRARDVAAEALAGRIFAPAGLATFYHALSVFPGWAPRMHAAAIIGAHIFYRVPGAEGDPARFRNAYPGVETVSGPSGHAFLPPDALADRTATLPNTPLPAPAPEARPAAQPAPALPGTGSARGLPDSSIRPEYQDSGRALR